MPFLVTYQTSNLGWVAEVYNQLGRFKASPRSAEFFA